MLRKLITLTAALPDEPPTELQLWGFGPVETVKGTFTFDRAGAEALMAKWKDYGNELSWDYEHQAIKCEGAAPASAWCALELRDDGLWATNIRWTSKADAHIRAKEYRYFSPAFYHDKDGRIVEMVNIALTNIPATKNMRPLVAASRGLDLRSEAIALSMSFSDITRIVSEALQERVKPEDGYIWACEVYDDRVIYEHDGKLWQTGYTVDGATVALDEQAVEVQRTYTPIDPPTEGGETTMKTLLKALGLPETATEAEAMVALTALQGDGKQLMALTGKTTPAEALGVFQAWKAAADQVTTLSTENQQLKQQLQSGEVTALVDKAIADGKATPAQKELLTKMGAQDIATLTAYLEAAPVIAPAGAHNPPPSAGAPVTLSKEDEAVIAQLGMDPKAFEAAKKAKQA